MAAVSVVLPWSMWPMVPTLMCGLVRTNFCLAIREFLLFSQLGLALRPSLARPYHILSWSQPLLAADFHRCAGGAAGAPLCARALRPRPDPQRCTGTPWSPPCVVLYRIFP